MSNFVFANNVSTTLATAVASTATSLVLASVTNLPASIPSGDYFVVTLTVPGTAVWEVCYATAISSATLTVLRGQEGTTAQAWAAGAPVYNTVTAGQMQSLGAAMDNPMTTVGDIITATTGGAPVRLGSGAAGYLLTATGVGAAIEWAVPPVVVTSFNGRTGAVALESSDVTTALGYTPYSINGGTVYGGASFVDGVTFDSGVQIDGGLQVGFSTAYVNSTLYGNLIVYGTTTTQASDRRIKTNIVPISAHCTALDIVEQALVGVEFDHVQDGSHASGFIAQDVEVLLPHLVQQAPHGDIEDFRTMDYSQTIPYLAAAITELRAIVREQALQIERLQIHDLKG